jgi:hypothetical protein
MRALRAASAALILASCTSGPPGPTGGASPPSVAPVVSPVAGAGELRLPALVADPSAPPGPWEEVLVVPFGPAPRKLGFEAGSGSAPRGPTSFAIPGGAAESVWIADPVKGRIVHYSLTDGAVLDVIHVPGHEPLGDLVATGGDDPKVWAVLDGPRGVIAAVGAGGLGDPETVRDAGVRYAVDGLLADHGRLVAVVRGAGETGFGRLRTADGRVARWEPGVRAGGSVSVDLGTGSGGGELEVHWFHYQHQLATGVAPLELEGANASKNATVAVARLQGTAPDGALAWVTAAPAGGGRGSDWILAVPPDPSAAMLFERLPEAGVASDQVRSLAVSPDGRLWLMVTEADGVHLFRR